MRLPTVVVRGEVLASWLTVSDYSQSKLANELGVSKGRVSQLLTSIEEPSAHLVAKLIMLTRLPFERLFKVIHETPRASSSMHRRSPTKRKQEGSLSMSSWRAYAQNNKVARGI